jgi:hypothetical protein
MIYPRVNLIKKSERRYQGAVSRKFLLVSLVLTPAFLVAILGGVKLIQYTSVRKELASSEELWATKKPRLDLFYQEQSRLQENEKMLAMVVAWEASQVELVELFGDLQRKVPVTVQLTRASLKGEVKRDVFTEAGQLGIKYSLTVQGLSHGEEAEAVVFDFRQNLQGTATLGEVFPSLQLVTMRKRTSNVGENIREFIFEGSLK